MKSWYTYVSIFFISVDKDMYTVKCIWCEIEKKMSNMGNRLIRKSGMITNYLSWFYDADLIVSLPPQF